LGYDIAAGSRNVQSSDVRVHQPWYRETMGKTFNLIVKSILLDDFKDTQCGFKLFRGDVARDLAREIRIDGFCFDVEMLYLAKIRGYRIKEAGVVWDNSPQSRVKVFNSSLNMFLDLFRIRVLHR
jgi:dolichyl-phosphate beta-glucosyltransferase